MARTDRTDEAAALDIVERFETYEDYLDSQLTSNDMNYLGDEEMARQLVELNYTGLGNCMKREVCIWRQLLFSRSFPHLYWNCFIFCRTSTFRRKCSLSAPTKST